MKIFIRKQFNLHIFVLSDAINIIGFCFYELASIIINGFSKLYLITTPFTTLFSC